MPKWKPRPFSRFHEAIRPFSRVVIGMLLSLWVSFSGLENAGVCSARIGAVVRQLIRDRSVLTYRGTAIFGSSGALYSSTT